ncbi:MAG: hypothetical protein RL264_504 [Bacteroidota bacterium]|jgi:23S rRNA (guanosine2251-2'-O)-methyltransferase
MIEKKHNNRPQRPQRNVQRDDIIFGVHAVVEAIKAGKEINKILIQKGIDKDNFFALKEALKGQDFNLQYVPTEKLNALTSGNHQGVIAMITPIEYHNFEAFINTRVESGAKTTLLVLDRITDVRNFGAIARTAECEGVDAIVIPSKGSALVTADAIKTSAGALNRIPVCKVDNLKNALFYAQQSGFRLVACTEKSKNHIFEVNLRGNVALIFGSEEDGITQDLINMSDISAKIPMRGTISSLNVGVSVGMVLYEKIKQDWNA